MEQATVPADPVGPFGNPDGSWADLDTLLDGFVDFRGNPAFGALATRASDAVDEEFSSAPMYFAEPASMKRAAVVR